MADTKKTIQVNIDVVVNQAKAAMTDIANVTKKTADSFDKMGASANKATAEIQKTTGQAVKASGGFLDMAKGVFAGQAAYDLFKKAVGGAVDFIKGSINESIEAAAVMARVKTNVENAGFAFAEIGPKLDAYSTKMVQMGFDDESTSESVSKLLGITHNYTQAISLNQLAMDLARNKNVSLEQATLSLSQVLQGAGAKALVQYGLSFKDGASSAEILYQLQEKVKGSAEGFATTTAGKLASFKEQWANLKQEVGDKLSPAVDTLMKTFQENLPTIIKMVGQLADALASVVGWFGKLSGNELDQLYDKTLDAVSSTGKYTDELHKALAGQSEFTAAQIKSAAASGEAAEKVTILTEKQKILNQYLQDGKVTIKEVNNLKAIGVDNIPTLNIFADRTVAVKDALKGMQTEVDAANKVLDANKETTAKVDKALGDLSVSGKNASNTFAGLGTAGGDASKSAGEYEQKVKDLANAFLEVKNKQTEFTFQSASDFDKFTKLLANTKLNQDQWISAAKQGFTAYSAAVKAIDTDIANLNKKIDDAKKSLADFTTATTKSSGSGFAQIVHDAEKAIPDLQKKISEAQSNGQDTSDLQKQLADAQAVIDESNKTQYNAQNDINDANYQLSVQYHQQLDLLRKQDSQNALQIAYETMLQQIADKQAETKAVIEESEKQIAQNEDQKTKYLIAQDAMTKAFGEAIKLRQKSSKAEIASLSELVTAVNAARDAYIAMAAAAAKAGSAGKASGAPVSSSSTGKASGGNINPGQTYMVGENGPERFVSSTSGNIIPNDKLVGSAPVININISNPSIRSEDDIHQLAREIGSILGRQEELARFGSLK